MTEYQPGKCNIGEAEQRRRYALGAVASIATLALVTWVFTTGGPLWYLAFSALPLFAAAEGYFQGRFQFCTRFAALGVYDVSTEGDDRREVPTGEAGQADKRRARVIHAYSAAVAVAGTALLYGVATLEYAA